MDGRVGEIFDGVGKSRGAKMVEVNKKIGFFKRLKKDVKIQILFCMVNVFVIGALYFLLLGSVKDNVIERKILESNAGTDATIYYDISIDNQEDILGISGWLLKENIVFNEVRIALKESHTENIELLKTNKVENTDAIEYADILGIEQDLSECGFESDISVKDIRKTVCYEVILYVTYEDDNTKISKTLFTNCYLYNEQLYSYNPKEFYAPVFVDEKLNKVVSEGVLCGYNAENKTWIYLYDEYLYWVLDTKVDRNNDENLYMFFHLYTVKDLLSDDRQIHGFNNMDFNFDNTELPKDNGYRIAMRKIETEYPITYLNTGHYSSEKGKLWSIWCRGMIFNDVKK